MSADDWSHELLPWIFGEDHPVIRHVAPPLGVMPYHLWRDQHPSPTLAEWLARYIEVSAAVGRYKDAGLRVNFDWLLELGVVTGWKMAL